MGDQIIFMGDLNDNVRSSKIVKFFEDLSMREIITGKHNSQQAPNTYDRGSKPIDGIWATFHLEPHRCGYTAFNHGCGGDHQISWAEFGYENAYGHDMPVIERPIARRLRLHDPRIVDKFNELREEYCSKHNLAVRTITNEQRATYPPSAAHNKEHEEIDR
eukprot:scaffold325734_cov35-Attheya_sp.AAC.1